MKAIKPMCFDEKTKADISFIPSVNGIILDGNIHTSQTKNNI